MNFINIIKNNAKIYIILGVIILLGSIGITFSLIMNNFNAIGINTTAMEIDASISYDTNSNGAEVISNGNMLPISDSLVTGPDVTDIRVLKAKFNVTGNASNPANTIYDIALHDIDIDCDLRTKDLKWRLYKGSTLLSEGSLSPTFDTMANNRMVLTNTQEDLTMNIDNYTFLLWISESCTGDISQCDPSLEQSKYLNKTLSASIKVELSTRSKKTLTRITGSEGSCSYIPTEVPVCNSVTYNGGIQTLVNTGSNYTLINNSGTNAGTYAVTLKLNDGYKWSNGETDNKVVYCNIAKKDAVVTTLDQTIVYGSNIDSTPSNVSVENLLSGNTLDSVSLTSSIVEVGEGTISTNNVKIVNSDNEDVTYNYNITKNNTGKVTITCLNTAEEPSINDKIYNGSEQTGVTGGQFVDISGDKTGTEIGEYKVTVVPRKNYCFVDNTTTEREYTWNITGNELSIELNDKTASYTGDSILVDEPTIKDRNGTILTNIPVSYKYYSGNSCSGNIMNSAPINAGSYSVVAYTNKYAGYNASVSNCAKLTIEREDASMSVDPTSLSLAYPTTGTFTYTYTGDGTISCSSSVTDVATCTVDTTNKKVTVTPVAGGIATITLSAAQGTNYNTISKTVSVTVSYTNYTVTLDNQDATSAGTTAIYGRYSNGIYLDSGYTRIMTISENSITVPTKTGYTFGGYYTQTNGGGTQLINASGNITSSFTNTLYNSNVTLYAKWTVNSYTLTVNPNGGSYKGSTSNTTVTQNYNTTYGLFSPSKSGHYFSSWSLSGSGTLMRGSVSGYASNIGTFTRTSKTDTDGSAYTNYSLNQTNSSSGNIYPYLRFSNYSYTSGHTYRISVMIRNKTASGLIYLQMRHAALSNDWGSTGFVAKSITVSSDWVEYTMERTFTGTTTTLNGNTVNISPCFEIYAAVAAGNTGVIDLDVKNLTIYDVTAGTYISSNEYGGYVYRFGAGNGTTTASWTPQTYRICFDANGGTGAPSCQTKTYGVTLTLSSTKPTRTDYTFLGWSTDKTATSSTYSAGGSFTVNANTTLYAVWKSNYTDAYVNGKSGTLIFSQSSASPAWMNIKIRVTWSEEYNAFRNTSIVSITKMELSSSEWTTTFYLGGAQGVNDRGLYINGTLVERMNHYQGTHGCYAGSSYVTVNPNAGTAYPWKSAAITHASDGTLTVPIRLYLRATNSAVDRYSDFNSSQNITLTDTRP